MNDDEQPAEGQAAGVNQAAIDWAWSQPVANNPGARMALLCLARRVDEMWECTASQEEVAMDAMVAPRSMRRYLDQLEEEGFIARRKRVGDKGVRLPGVVQLNPSSEPVAKLASGGDQQEQVAAARSTWSEPVAKLASGKSSSEETPSSEPVAKLASGPGGSEMDGPAANLASGSDQQERPVANLASGQQGLWDSPPTEETPSSEPVAKLASGKSGTIESSSSQKKNKRQNLSSSGIRDDVEQLCTRLLAWLVKKDYRPRPDEVSDAWRTEARLLLDKDGVDLAEAIAVLDWSQRDHFWHKNIHSMPKFREKYGDLEFKSRGQRGDTPSRQQPPQGNGSGSQVPPRGTPRRPFGNRKTA